MKFTSKAFFVVLLLVTPVFSRAQTTETQAEREARLKAELVQVEKEQAETEKILGDAQNQSASLQRDILILDTKIKAAQLNIRAKNILIESLGKDISKKEQHIEGLEERIDRGRETLAQIMRKTNEVDSYTMAEFLLTKASLTEVFSDLDTFESVQESLKTTFEQIRNDKAQTETEKNALNKRKNSEEDARAVIQTEKKNIENDEKEKERLLVVSKGNEITYGQLLAQKRAKAAEIRAALFSLAGGAQAIPFELALKYANEANRATGIRPAFLLAILTQESDLGKNVGSCYLTDPNTGAGASVKSGTIFPNVMKPTRDVGPFIEITKSLGMDYAKTLVSCPIPSAGGWGGAMGPAQFIASTWMLFKDRINKVVNSTPNPWNPEHAFVASSLYLTDLGAYSGSYSAEVRAACKYYGTGGSSCSYGRQVLAKADTIQRTMIDPLQGL